MITNKIKIFCGCAILLLAFSLTACAPINIQQYAKNTPKLDLFDFFTGETRGWGIVQSRNGTLLRQFVVDIIGYAKGEAAGNVLNGNYVLNLKVDNSTWKIRFDDWMFLQQDNILINRAQMKKFGFRVGEITIAFMKK